MNDSSDYHYYYTKVALHGAWIETIMPPPPKHQQISRPYTGAWIKTYITIAEFAAIKKSPPTRGVVETPPQFLRASCRPTRGVD